MDLTRQLSIIHLSDVHFGAKNRFNPAITAHGDRATEDDYPTLLDKLAADLAEEDPECPVCICITGDLTETGAIEEFQLAERFVQDLANTPIFGVARGLSNVFVIPGNHDVRFDAADVGIRWQQWSEFHNRLTGEAVIRERPWDLVRLHDRVDDLGTVILSLNSAIYVQQGKPDQVRGRIDIKQLDRAKSYLEAFEHDRLQSAIRIALIHHHPVLIPALVEPGRGYDAIDGSGLLLTLLRQYGFHLVLHGHKHHPHTFSHDVGAAYSSAQQSPLLIVAGGSISSTALPSLPNSQNCYNRIMVKWHPGARQSRVRIDTRGLRTFNPDGTEELPTRWRWETLRLDDRSFMLGEGKPTPRYRTYRDFSSTLDVDADRKRVKEYERTRGNLPVVEVMPSLVAGQAYEARAWIVHHGPETDESRPIEVIWRAGGKFPVLAISREVDPLFCVVFNYWGPALVQATLRFEDGAEEAVCVYARMPTDYSS